MNSVRIRRLVFVALCLLVVRGSHGGSGENLEIFWARGGGSLASFRDALNAVELDTLTECLSIWDMRSEMILPESYRHSFDFAPERTRSRRTRVVTYETEYQTVDLSFAVYAPRWSSGGRGNRARPMVADRNGFRVLRLALADPEIYQYLEERMTRSESPAVDLWVEQEDSVEGDEFETYNFGVVLEDGEVFSWRATYSSSSQTAFFAQTLP